MMIMLVAGSSRWPIIGNSRQISAARSLTEAEVIAMASAIYSEAQPLRDILGLLLQREITTRLWEDNSATLTLLINLASLAEICCLS